MDDQYCPRCKTTKYRNPSLKLMVNVCGHALCENCVELLFVRGSGACPQCNVALRRNNFRLQLFEDAIVEKDTDIRKRILRDFNKREEDFATLREYNDYLEEVENIIFNLCNGIDVEETKEKIENYKKENKDVIRKNRAKMSHEEVFFEDLIEQEKQKEKAREQHIKEEILKKKVKLKNKEALIDDLMSSDLPADHILAQHQHEHSTEQQPSQQTQRLTQFSSGIQIGKQTAFIPIPKVEEGVCYTYHPLEMDILGPSAPQETHLSQYLQHMRGASDAEKGGGYVEDIACRRALQEAFCGLFFTLHQDIMAASDRVSPYMEIS